MTGRRALRGGGGNSPNIGAAGRKYGDAIIPDIRVLLTCWKTGSDWTEAAAAA